METEVEKVIETKAELGVSSMPMTGLLIAFLIMITAVSCITRGPRIESVKIVNNSVRVFSKQER